MIGNTRWRRFLIWRLRHINNRSFILILSVLIGIASGMTALVLKTAVYRGREFLLEGINWSYQNYLFFLYPMIGVGLTLVFRKYILRDLAKHNLTSLLHAISKKNSIVKLHKTYSSVIGAIITAGFGGSIGLESPIISSGAAIGSNMGRNFHLDYKEITLMLACGASGAIAAIFNTPIAAIVFALEVLLIDLSRFSLIPLLMASVSGAITTKLFLDEDILIEFAIIHPFVIRDIPFFILLGILSGLVSVYFTKTFLWIEKRFEQFKFLRNKMLIGGLSLGILIFYFPALYGEGYNTVKALVGGNLAEVFRSSLFEDYTDVWYMVVIFIGALVFFKVIAASITLGAGGIGGIFAPSVFTGAMLGFLFVFVYNHFELGEPLSESNFTLVGMASVLGGVLHAPLTGIFLIAEITSGYELIVPLMLSTTISFITVKSLQKESIITAQLAKRGELITHNKDLAVLRFMKLSKVIETDLISISEDGNLGDLVKVISKSKRNIFPVLTEEGYLIGIILLDEVREIMFNSELYSMPISNFMIMPPASIAFTDSMEKVLAKFKETGVWNLPVLDQGKYVGFVSKSKLFSAYRQHLLDITAD
ncbi:chloride channel protein [Labilibaculum euxinus]|uniref:CBS domain-containing protein n=1 Tax=Labilibaculum euxinus TaxID=2686357 RepID=A0A7M4D478_9BACT|nr:chloride channel protein [Labilibaculum euxinus]MUP37457.1 CBS domain-containing protein [Labilibaculum euxinus]MVB06662.1 CBS domain-containing protein [Labilibaculum euxinus]